MDVPPAGTRIGDSIVLDEEVDSTYIPTENEIQDYASWLGVTLITEPYLLPILKEGLVSPLPPGWRPCKSIDTSLASSSSSPSSSTVPVATNNGSNDIYYFSFLTGESTWEHPCDTLCKLKISEARLQHTAELTLHQNSSKNIAKSSLSIPFTEQRNVVSSPPPSPSPVLQVTSNNNISSSSVSTDNTRTVISSSSKSFSSGTETSQPVTIPSTTGDTNKSRSKSNSKFGNRLHTAINSTPTPPLSSSSTLFTSTTQLEEVMMEQTVPSASSVPFNPEISSIGLTKPFVGTSSSSKSLVSSGGTKTTTRTVSPPPVPLKTSGSTIPSASSSSSSAFPHSVQETRERLNKEISNLRAQHAKDIMMYREAHAAELEKLRIASERSIEELRTKSIQQKQNIQEKTLREIHSTESQAGQEVRKVEENHTATLASLRRSHEEAINAIRKRYAAEERETERNVRAEVERLRTDNAMELSKQRQVHENELTVLNLKHDTTVNDIRSMHENEVNSVLKEQREEIDQIWKQHQQNLQSLQEQVNKERETYRIKLEESKRNEAKILDEARELENKAHARRSEAVNAVQNAQTEFAKQQQDYNEQFLNQQKLNNERLRNIQQESEEEIKRIQNECTEKGNALQASLHAELSTMLMDHTNETKIMKDEFEVEKKRLRMEMIMNTEERKEFVSDGYIASIFSLLRSLVQEGMGITQSLRSFIERIMLYSKQSNLPFREPNIEDILKSFKTILSALSIHESNAQHNNQTNDNAVKRQFRVKAVGDALEITTNSIRNLHQLVQQTETNSKDVFDTVQTQRVSDASLHIARIAELTVELETTKSQLASTAVRLVEAEKEIRKVRQQSTEELANLTNQFAVLRSESNSANERSREQSMDENAAVIKSLKGRVGMSENRVHQLEAELQTMKTLLNEAEERVDNAERAMYENNERESMVKEQIQQLKRSMVIPMKDNDRMKAVPEKIVDTENTSTVENSSMLLKLRNDLHDMRSQLLTETRTEERRNNSLNVGPVQTYTEVYNDILSFYSTEKERFEKIKTLLLEQQTNVKNDRTTLLMDRELWKKDAQSLVDSTSNTVFDVSSSSSSSLADTRRILLKEVKQELDHRTSRVNDQLLKLERSFDTLQLPRLQECLNELSHILCQIKNRIERKNDGIEGEGEIGNKTTDTSTKKGLIEEWRNRTAWNDPTTTLMYATVSGKDGKVGNISSQRIQNIEDGITKALRIKGIIQETYSKYEDQRKQNYVIDVPVPITQIITE